VGGGGSLINMAEDFPLWKFHINDNNKDVASLWKFFRAAKNSNFEELYDRIFNQKVNVQIYKEIYASKPSTQLERAFRVIFLNKTSYNGLITLDRPIGGWEQNSKWNVDVYWTPKNIVRKIERARRVLNNRILSVSAEDFETFLDKTPSNFTYCDPPYITFGKQWYGCNFGITGLNRLKETVSKRENWCISIDRHVETETLFKDCNCLGVDVIHTAKSSYKSNKVDKSIAKSNEIVVFPGNTPHVNLV
jgi:DNA adenine methylase